MKSSRHAVLATASLLAVAMATPTLVKAENQQQRGDEDKNKKSHGKEGNGEQRHFQEGKPPGQPHGAQGNNPEKHGQPAFRQQPPPNIQHKQFGNGAPSNAFIKPMPPKPPVVKKAVVPQQPQLLQQQLQQEHLKQQHLQQQQLQQQQLQQQRLQHENANQQHFNKSGGKNNNNDKAQFQQPTGKPEWKHNIPGTQPAPVGNPGPLNKPVTPNFVAPNTSALSPADAKRRFEAIRGQRKEVKIDGGKGVVIEEPGRRRIIRDNNRVVITHDDTERLRRVAPNARFEKGKGGTNIAVIDRPGGYRIYSETDANGQLIRRYRRGPDGRDFIIIDNRRRRHDNFGRNIATGVGIGIGVVAGAAILDSILDVPPPRVTIPRDEYIVDYDRASDEDVYDALSAPPVEDFRDRYTLDEIRATAALRDRMRRVDLDDITFDFGSWEVNPSEYGKLDRIARAMRRIINRNPNEVFMIEGYTDAVGSPEDNLSLSDRRAESVAEVLSQQFQIPFENLTTQGYGEEYLKVPTQAPERLNRRVAVRRITPLLARGGNGAPPPPRDDQSPGYDGPPQGGPDDGGSDDGPDDGPPPRGD